MPLRQSGDDAAGLGQPQPRGEGATAVQQLTKPGQPAPCKSFSGFEKDPWQEQAAQGGRERSFSRPCRLQWDALKSEPCSRKPFQ